MKKLYRMLNLILWSVIGVFIGGSIYQYYDYKTYSDIYVRSAPWYLSIEMHAIFTAIVVVVILIIMQMLKKKME